MDALATDPDLAGAMPAWFHKFSTTNMNNSPASKCLRNNHDVLWVADLTPYANDPNPRHSRRINCACAPCKYDRSMGCKKPYACQEQARQLLGALDPKWNPSLEILFSNPALTPDEILENEDAFADKQPTTFNPNIFITDHLASALRVF
ncbi:hypothetical protein C8F01DRAFT_990229, partial [Mycena amicta]